jgi:hypothetical protein
MIVLRKLILVTAIAAGSGLLSPQEVSAFELTGAWATSADQCSRVFARKGRANRVTFTNFPGVCTENQLRVDEAMESPKLAE